MIAQSWPLQWWGINIVGKLTPAQGNYTFSIVAVEYFTKWVEVKLVTNVSSTAIQKKFWQTLFATMEFHSKSQSTMPSTLIVACSRISVTR
jgi:hypothetical protein